MEGPGKLPPLSSHNNTQALISSGNMAGQSNYATDAGCDFLVMMRCRRLHRTHDARQDSTAQCPVCCSCGRSFEVAQTLPGVSPRLGTAGASAHSTAASGNMDSRGG